MCPPFRAHKDEYIEQLPAYVLGALDPDQAARLEVHVAHCPDCAALLLLLEQTAAALPWSLTLPPTLAGHSERFRRKLAGIIAATPGAPNGLLRPRGGNTQPLDGEKFNYLWRSARATSDRLPW